MIDIEQQLRAHLGDRVDTPSGRMMVRLLRALLHEEEINRFIQDNRHLRGFAFLDRVLDYFDFHFRVDPEQLAAIPPQGRLIIVANHPIGSLDGLALLKLVRMVRPDVRIVANELLNYIEPLGNLFIPVDNMRERGAGHKSRYRIMLEALRNEQALIIFPAGEVSRIRPNGVRDGRWKAGFVKLALKTGAPVQPILVEAHNSPLFYGLSALYKPLGTLMLAQEMFNKRHQTIRFHVSLPIPARALRESGLSRKTLAQRMRRYTYLLRKPKKLKKKALFPTLSAIAPPVDREALKSALADARLLGTTADGKRILLYDWQDDSPVMREIGRLRELTFRSVEEGTGQSLDLDEFDRHYRHLILWDERDEEIVGAYRIGHGPDIMAEQGAEGFYSHTLFEFLPELQKRLPRSIELGRSFVQPRYWGRRSLDYLWYGIGAYLKAHPEIRWMFGPVSLSRAYPEQARALIALFYQTQFPPGAPLVRSRHPFAVPDNLLSQWQPAFSSDYATAFRALNRALAQLGVKVPTLYKQYAEIALPGGCEYAGFSIDPAFNDCVDGLVMVDCERLVPKKRDRYMGVTGTHSVSQESGREK
ncbi:lysophospholipid acyltransferase family protein [Sulfurivirga sp.]|uniref:lysophospholipid acyltransferase family protein n=1 Tax=Sulfurivirga sp. TaxID=2614236 RepID=UPI0025FA4E73|nr:lysophospholipid acyltransferase family protein [Sulfurivirga sp.]